MTDEKIKLIIGSLLHDIGKVVYREGDDRRNHSISGYDFLKENGGIDDKEILNCVRYHHISALKGQNCRKMIWRILCILQIILQLLQTGERKRAKMFPDLICQFLCRVFSIY